MPLIEGTEGLIQIGPSATPTTIGVVSEFSVECETEINRKGPYIGDPTIRKTRKAKTSSGSLSADIPEGRDVGQTRLLLAHENGENIRLMLRGGDATNGYEYEAANVAVAGVNFTGNAEEGYSFEFNFEDMDGYTLTPSA